MSIAGIVYYQVKADGTLDGRWIHQDSGVMFAKTRAWGGIPGQLAGRYCVQFHTPGEQVMYDGTLDVMLFETCYLLHWIGTMPNPNPSAVEFSGIGVLGADGVLFASFQETIYADGSHSDLPGSLPMLMKTPKSSRTLRFESPVL